MKNLSIVIAIIICLSFIGCPTRSLSPLFTQKDLTFNAALIGSWKYVKESGTITFQKSGDKEYIALLTEKEKDTTKYKIQLGQLGGFWFMDSYSANKNEDYQLLPTHLIWRIWLNGDTLRLASLEGDWLKQMIDGKKIDIEHARQDGDVVLTASTEELQKFVAHYAEDDKAFPKPDTYIRMK